MMRSKAVAIGLVLLLIGSGCGGGGGGGTKKNKKPTLDPIPSPQMVATTMTLAFQVTASDPKGDPLTLDATPLPANATFVDNGNGTGDFSFTPDVTQVGNHAINFSVQDLVNAPIIQGVIIQVVANLPPTFTPAIPTPQYVLPLSNLSFGVTTNDPDGDPVTLDATPLPANATFTDNGNGTGNFSFTPDATQASTTYTITFSVQDSTFPAQTQDVDVAVNEPPVLTLPPSPQLAIPGTPLNFQATATDPDLDPLTLGAIPLPPNATFVDNGNGTGDFSMTAAPNQGGASYIVVFSVSDGINPSVTQNMTIDVQNQPPVWSPVVTPRDVPEGSLANIPVSATDGEGDPLTLTAAPLPPGSSWVDNGNGTGLFTITPQPATAGTQYTVTFGADDGINPVVNMDLVLNVIAPNAPPAWTPPIPTPQLVSHGGNLNFTVTAVDPEADAMVLSAIPLWSGMSFTDNGNGTGDFSYTPEFAQGGTIRITFRAADPYNIPTTQNVDIIVSGNGNGTFVEVIPAPVVDFGGEGWGIDGGDFDGDGNIDLAVADRDPTAVTPGLVILLGDGTGQFTMTPESPYACGVGDPQPRHPTVGDFDEDGALDIAIGAVNEGDLYIFMGDGGASPDGTFTEHPTSPMALGDIHHLDTGDFDEDGHVDIVAVAYGNTNVYVLMGDGTGAFTLTPQSPLDSSPGGAGLMHVSLADFTNDGILDFLVTHWVDELYNLFEGEDAGLGVNTNARFTSPQGAIGTSIANPGLGAIGDYNEDGNMDFAIGEWGNPAQASIMRGNGVGIFAEAPVLLDVGQSAEYGSSSDFDGDGVADLCFAAVWSDELYIYLGDGTAAFTAAAGSPIATGRAPRVIYVNDFNNDNIADIAGAFQANGELYVYLGQ